MKRSSLYLATLTMGACIGMLLGVVFLLTHERRIETEPVGPSERALRDPFRAATLLLEEMGVPTEPRYGLGELPKPDAGAVVVVLSDDYEHRRRMATRLFDWVTAGGHVVFAPEHYENYTITDGPERPLLATDIQLDPMLEAFGLWSRHDGTRDWSVPTVMTIESSQDTPFTVVTDQRVHVGGLRCLSTTGTGKPESPSIDAPLRATLRTTCGVAAGRVTAVSSVDLFQNDALMDVRGNNAAFFWDTVAPDAPPEAAILVLRGDAPSFFTLVWARCWPLLVSLAFCLLGWAAWEGQRFGPTLDRPMEVRRSMLEHLDASGAILWRHRRFGALAIAMRRAVRARLARQDPSIAQLEGAALAEVVAEVTGRPIDTIQRVLTDPPPAERRAFVEMVQILQQIWRSASPVSSGSSA